MLRFRLVRRCCLSRSWCSSSSGGWLSWFRHSGLATGRIRRNERFQSSLNLWFTSFNSPLGEVSVGCREIKCRSALGSKSGLFVLGGEIEAALKGELENC